MRGKTCISILLAVSTATFFFWRVTSSSGSVVTHRRVPEFHDWSTRHVVYPNGGFLRELDLAAMDPRASIAWRNRLPDPETRRPLRLPIRHPLLPRRRTLQRDWS